jgi:hypothetical protein
MGSLVPGWWSGPRTGRRRTGAAWPKWTGRRALFRTAVILVVLASLVSPTGPGAAASVTTTTSGTAPSNLSGTWYMTDTWTTGGGVSTDETFANQTSPGVYTLYHASDASSITTDVPISGSSFYYWSCNGGGTYNQSDESACQTGWFDTTWNRRGVQRTGHITRRRYVHSLFRTCDRSLIGGSHLGAHTPRGLASRTGRNYRRYGDRRCPGAFLGRSQRRHLR